VSALHGSGQWHLVFDAQCSVCTSLAQEVKRAAGGKLDVISIHDDRARALLDQAFPGGWEHAPYLVQVKNGRVHARTSTPAAARLGLILGPRKAWRVWRLAQQAGISAPIGLQFGPGHNTTRRHALRAGAALVGVTALLGWRRSAPAAAQTCFPTGVIYYCYAANCFCTGERDNLWEYLCCYGNTCYTQGVVACCAC
jgi:predicted DCC family thiol-disulfide oxidoreductase YuxK